MTVALDTNAYSDFLRGVPGRVEIVRAADRIFLPLIVIGELRAGFSAGNREA
jgi:tRNA(fMet)-specific endonuclease VapC